MNYLLDLDLDLDFDDVQEKPANPTQTKRVFVERDIKTSDTPSRGRRQCLNCKLYIGVRNKVCICGYEFDKPKIRVASPKEITFIENPIPSSAMVAIASCAGVGRFDDIILTPSGKVPFAPDSFDETGIHEWATRLRESELRKGRYLTAQAIIFYARQFAEIHSNEFREMKMFIENWEKQNTKETANVQI